MGRWGGRGLLGGGKMREGGRCWEGGVGRSERSGVGEVCWRKRGVISGR